MYGISGLRKSQHEDKTNVDNFKRISKEDLEKRMKYILDQENIKYEYKALAVIAQVADGGIASSQSNKLAVQLLK